MGVSSALRGKVQARNVVVRRASARSHRGLVVRAGLGEHAQEAAIAVQQAPTLQGGAQHIQTLDVAARMAQHMPLATGVGLPCTVMNCGDVTYRR